MNFFEHQDRARRSTTRLVLLFTLAVIAIVAALNLAAFAITRGIGGYEHFQHTITPRHPELRPIWGEAKLYIGVSIASLVTIFSGSLYKMAQLRSGGSAVAQSLGGSPLLSNSLSPADRQLQNIVEEMAIASGVPVPQVWVMRSESGINAFAAGFTPADAVIAVTQGCIDRLNRDELQGVVAHEFSHILNGDMRLNLRLIGILNGILVIALIGYFLLRSGATSGASRSNRDRGGNNGILLAGLMLVVIGYVGVFFGRLIQAAVSRQREFLADASAVQFTRNPAGIVSALKKIGASTGGSQVNNAQALGTAHLFFASAFRVGFTQLLATHPPLVKRIRAIDPTFDGKFPLASAATEILDTSANALRGNVLAQMLTDSARQMPIQLTPSEAIQHAGTISSSQIRFAAELVAAIPDQLRAAAREPFLARLLVMALVTNEEPDIREKQRLLVQMALDAGSMREYLRLLDLMQSFQRGSRLPLLNLSLPALRQLSPAQAKEFLSIVRRLIEADQRVTLFEFALHRIVEKQLQPQDQSEQEPMRYFSVTAVRDDAAVLLTALASASTTETGRAFVAGAEALDVQPMITLTERPGLKAIEHALEKLALSSPPVKKRVISAVTATIAADGELNVAEAELLRATCATLGVPIPLFLAEPRITEKLS